MTELELIAVCLSILPFIACFVELFFLRRDVRDARETCIQFGLRLREVEKALAGFPVQIDNSGVDTGLYVERKDPVTQQSNYVKAEDQGPWRDLLNDSPHNDLLDEMIKAARHG